MTNEITNEEEKILLSFKNKLKIHIVLKKGDWRNGYVKDILTDFFIFDDVINGEEPIFFIELKKVEPYVDKKVNEVGNENNI